MESNRSIYVGDEFLEESKGRCWLSAVKKWREFVGRLKTGSRKE